MKRILDGWALWALVLTIAAIIVAAGNIHFGPEGNRISPWNWAWPAFYSALFIGRAWWNWCNLPKP